MSFGFSVGDFLAAGKLIHDVIESLHDVGGAKSEYQELIRELRSLENALQYLDNLQSDHSSQDRTVQSIKFAALSCRQPLEQFLAKIKKFDSTLDVWAKGQPSKSIVRKVHWGLSMKNEVTKLQGYLNLHIATINMLLVEHSLEKMNMAQNRAESDSFQVRERLGAAQDVIERIGNSVVGQMALIQHTHTTMRSLMNMICGEFRTSWRSLGQMVAQLCVSMQQIHGVVLEIKASIIPVDTRFTFFQTPLVCEDALGFKFPIPSEWDYGMVENHIRYRFREGIGSRSVKVGNWELFKTKNSEEVISSLTRLLPGLEITMAIIVPTSISSEETCPVFNCRSHETTLAPAGGRICCMCGTYFSRATKKRIGLEALAEAIDSKSSETTHGRAYKDASSSHRGEGVQDYSILRSEHDRLKNVRWSEEEHLELGSSDHKFEMEKPISNDALVYLDLIKSTFPAHPEIYNTFVETMQAFEKYSIDTLETVTRISGSFYEEKALSNDIKTFSSRGYTFQIDPHSDSHTIRIIAPDSITHTIIARAKRKQLDELDNREPDSIENGIDFVDQRKKRQKKPRRGSILANSDKP